MYMEHKRRRESIFEKFQPFDIQDFIRQIQMSSGLLQKDSTYDEWIGWLYTHVESSGKPLDDFKKRVFLPSCKFRNDWSTNIPQGLMRPFPPKTKELANMAYRSYLKCLSEGNQACINKLEDARVRFMEPNCRFLHPENPKEYIQNLQEVFV